MQLSVICAEDADRLRVNPARRAARCSARTSSPRCSRNARSGRRGRRPADFNAPVQSDRPVLLLSGQLDPVTPPRYGEAVVRHLPNGRHLVRPGRGTTCSATAACRG